MPLTVSRGWRLRTMTLAPASRSRCATGRPSVPVPPVTRIDVAIDVSLHQPDETGTGIPATWPPSRATAIGPHPHPADRGARDDNALLHVRYPFSSTCQTV